MQQIDEIWREMRWINEALQYARYRPTASGLPLVKILDLSEEPLQKKISSTSSHLDCLPSPPPSPEIEIPRRKAGKGKISPFLSIEVSTKSDPLEHNHHCKLELPKELQSGWVTFANGFGITVIGLHSRHIIQPN